MSSSQLLSLLQSAKTDNELIKITEKVTKAQRISLEDGVYLYKNAELGFLGVLANYVREQKHGNKTYFNRNFHIEPTNICVFDCKFCSYSSQYKDREKGWELTIDQMVNIVKKYDGKPVTEVHIVGGVHPKMDVFFFGELLEKIKAHRPNLHIKAFTPVELDYMFRKGKMNILDGLTFLKEKGLQSLPGGGAEIFDEKVRKEIAGDKCGSDVWLEIHETAHKLGIHSNATMLYGHIESFENRVDHMERLRTLQDKTGGFNTFIPLKFRNDGNQMDYLPESTVVEDLRNYAIARIYMDNFAHIKAYWPMIGRTTAQLSLAFGVNDIDGTIDDTTKIYSMAGSEEQSPKLTTKQLVELIKQVGRTPIERGTLYDVIQDYTDFDFANDVEVTVN